jgi:predicted transcriptional regulator
MRATSILEMWLKDERQQAVAGIQQGLEDVAAGRVQPIDEAFLHVRRGSMDQASASDLSE